MDTPKMIKYEVYIKGRISDTLKIVEVSDQDLLDRYEKIIDPSILYVKDLACKRGLYSWGNYTKLRIRRIK